MSQIMLIKCDPHSENQPSGLFENFKYAWVVLIFIFSSMFTAIEPLPYKV